MMSVFIAVITVLLAQIKMVKRTISKKRVFEEVVIMAYSCTPGGTCATTIRGPIPPGDDKIWSTT